MSACAKTVFKWVDLPGRAGMLIIVGNADYRRVELQEMSDLHRSSTAQAFIQRRAIEKSPANHKLVVSITHRSSPASLSS